MRIAFCQPELGPLGDAMRGSSTEAACIQQAYLAAGLAARGHHLTFVAPRGLDEVECTTDPDQPATAPRTWSASAWFDAVARTAWRAQRLVGLPYLNVFSNLRRYDACLRCLRGHDVVHERNGLYTDAVARACRRLGLPYVMFFDADQIAEHDFRGQPITGLLRWRAGQLLGYNLRVARRVVCVSEPARDGLVRSWGVAADKVVVFPNGVDTARFRPAPEARHEARVELALGDGPLVIFVGNFYEWHDVATLLEAFGAVRGAHPTSRLLLVGDGPTRASVQQRATELGLADAVRFTGLVPHASIPRLMAASDVAVAPVPPMERDSWLSPMKVFEYMASGLAVVASRSGQLASVIDEGRTGLLVPPGDGPALAAAVGVLLDDPARRVMLGTAARRVVVERHSWEQYVTRLERLYAAVATADPPRA